jgi:uncharacterized membrane protein
MYCGVREKLNGYMCGKIAYVLRLQDAKDDRINKMNRAFLFWAMIVSALVGLFMSAYLTYLSLMPPTSCPVGEYAIFSCNEVIYSKYSHIYGISVALLGLGWFIIALPLIILTRRDARFIRAVVGWSLLGAVGVAGFVYAEIFCLAPFARCARSRMLPVWQFSSSQS